MTVPYLTSVVPAGISHNAYLAGAVAPTKAAEKGCRASGTVGRVGTDTHLTSPTEWMVGSAQRPDSAEPASPESPGGQLASHALGSIEALSVPSARGGRGGPFLTPQSRPEHTAAAVDNQRKVTPSNRSRSWLADISAEASPEMVRTCLETYYELLDLADSVGPVSDDLRDLIAFRLVRGDITDGIAAARARLSKIAKRGGQGFPVQKAVSL